MNNIIGDNLTPGGGISPDNKNRKYFLMAGGLVVLVLLAVLVFAAFYKFVWPTPTPAPSGESRVKIQELRLDKKLADFPDIAELPLPASAAVIKSYRAIAPDGKTQVTKKLESSKSLNENFDYYKNLLKDKKYGWTIINEVNSASLPNHRAIFAENSKGVLNINLDFIPGAKKTTIDISFLIK